MATEVSYDEVRRAASLELPLVAPLALTPSLNPLALARATVVASLLPALRALRIVEPPYAAADLKAAAAAAYSQQIHRQQQLQQQGAAGVPISTGSVEPPDALDALQALSLLFPRTFSAALDLLAVTAPPGNDVNANTAFAHPDGASSTIGGGGAAADISSNGAPIRILFDAASGRSLYEVRGHLCVGAAACTCSAFRYVVTGRQEAPLCKHLLALHLAYVFAPAPNPRIPSPPPPHAAWADVGPTGAAPGAGQVQGCAASDVQRDARVAPPPTRWTSANGVVEYYAVDGAALFELMVAPPPEKQRRDRDRGG
jgi:hypothetical protein